MAGIRTRRTSCAEEKFPGPSRLCDLVDNYKRKGSVPYLFKLTRKTPLVTCAQGQTSVSMGAVPH